MPDRTCLSREELYDLVWSKSMRALAKDFNLSDVGLAKICKKYNIPRPGLGYWAKKEACKKVKQTPLPEPQQNPEISIDTSGQHRVMMERHAYSAEKLKAIEAAFTVPKTLKDPHPAIVKTRKAFQDDPHCYYKTTNILDIHVGNSYRPRALRIMDTLIKIMEKRGHAITVESRGHYHSKPQTSVVVQGQSIQIKLYHNSQGNLTFGIDSYVEGRKNWSDGKKQRVEDKLYEIVMRILIIARQKLHRSIRWRIEDRKKRELGRIQAEKERLRREEQERIQSLEIQAENWQKSLRIREYLTAAVDFIKTKYGGYEEESEFGQWLKWAHGHADRLDPLTESRN